MSSPITLGGTKVAVGPVEVLLPFPTHNQQILMEVMEANKNGKARNKQSLSGHITHAQCGGSLLFLVTCTHVQPAHTSSGVQHPPSLCLVPVARLDTHPDSTA